jgi:hypothetical protein
MFVRHWLHWQHRLPEPSVMKLRREFAVLISAAICAVALMFPAPKASQDLAWHGAPPFGFAGGVEMSTDGDAAMAALHQQASAALASLQAGSPARQ